MSSEVAFYTMLACFFTHELDAIKRHEWRMLPLTSRLPDRVGEQVFIWFHVPVFFVILWLAGSNPDSISGLVLSAFSIVHVGLHWHFRNHPCNEFDTLGSWVLILATGLFGALHILSASL